MTGAVSDRRIVLLVDDDSDIHLLVRTRLRRLNRPDIELRCASDGAEALEMLPGLQAGLHLILSDVNMPRVDGHSLLREARATGYGGAFVLIGGLASPRHDADAWIEKDRLLEDLPGILTSWLPAAH